MGLFDRLAAKFVPEMGDIELGMASDPQAPGEMLQRMAEREPKLWDTILANPSCPSETRQYITARRTAE